MELGMATEPIALFGCWPTSGVCSSPGGIRTGWSFWRRVPRHATSWDAAGGSGSEAREMGDEVR